jgi:hypothetical protein
VTPKEYFDPLVKLHDARLVAAELEITTRMFGLRHPSSTEQAAALLALDLLSLSTFKRATSVAA